MPTAAQRCSASSPSATAAATFSSTRPGPPARARSSVSATRPWQDGFALKFFGCVRLCRLFWPLLKTAHGHVVNIIGGAARTPDPEFLIGGSVNAAMHNFTKGLSGLGKRDGVNVNAILPGMTETERVEQLVPAACRGRRHVGRRRARRR